MKTEFLAASKEILRLIPYALGLKKMPKPVVRPTRKKSAPSGRNRVNTEADKKTKGTSPAQSPRKAGPAGLDTSGKAGPGGGTMPPGLTPDNKKVARGQKKIGSGGKTGTKDTGPTTSAKKTGTVKKAK